eukprot:scaffold38984_cov261-Skeletonema_dohrnii-CCMP3373.AAC.1
MAHQQYLLDATDEIIVSHHADEESVTFYEEPQVLTTSSYTTTASTDSVRNHLPKSFILSDVWKARMLLLLSAALYGTNFSV